MRYIYVKSLGTVEHSFIEQIAAGLDSLLPVPSKIVHDEQYPLFAFEPKRNQYYAKKIIGNLASDLPSDCEKMIAVTDIDLCTPVLTFVYGEAQLGGSVAIVSLMRLRQEFHHLPRNDELLVERVVKECIHELGHCYGLFHCSNEKCVMYFSSSIVIVDNKEKDFCIGCKEFLYETMREEHHE